MKKVLEENNKKIEIFNSTKHELPIVISIPHSGAYLSRYMCDNLSENIILSNMDWYLPKLYSFLKEMGFTTIINNVSRYVIDTNRNIEEKNIDDSYLNTSIYTKTTFGRNMYKEKIDSQEIIYRINECYVPYHQAIENVLKEKLKYFKTVYLIDLHSFGKDVQADIVLGNDDGKTASDVFVKFIKKLLEKEGFIVKNNNPYRGGYITKFYSNKIEGCETLQIELSYQTYIDRRKFGEEEFPNINEIVFIEAQDKLKNFFGNVKNEFSILNKKTTVDKK